MNRPADVSFSGIGRWLTVVAFVALVLAAPLSVRADSILTLVAEPAQTIGPQSTSAPCIIAGTNCQNPAGFGYTNFAQNGNTPAYDEESPVYTIAQFPFLQFDVAIDVNTSSAAGETLNLFEVWLGEVGTGTRLYYYDGNGNIGALSSNGNGYGDWTLRSVDLSAYANQLTQTIQFHAVWNGQSSGAESYFIVATEVPGPPVPEPTTLVLLGSGLGAIALASWRKRRS